MYGGGGGREKLTFLFDILSDREDLDQCTLESLECREFCRWIFKTILRASVRSEDCSAVEFEVCKSLNKI